MTYTREVGGKIINYENQIPLYRYTGITNSHFETTVYLQKGDIVSLSAKIESDHLGVYASGVLKGHTSSPSGDGDWNVKGRYNIDIKESGMYSLQINMGNVEHGVSPQNKSYNTGYSLLKVTKSVDVIKMSKTRTRLWVPKPLFKKKKSREDKRFYNKAGKLINHKKGEWDIE